MAKQLSSFGADERTKALFRKLKALPSVVRGPGTDVIRLEPIDKVARTIPEFEGPAYDVALVESDHTAVARLVVGWFGESWELGLMWRPFRYAGSYAQSLRDRCVIVDFTPSELADQFARGGIEVFASIGLTEANRRFLETLMRENPRSFRPHVDVLPRSLLDGVVLPPSPPPAPISSDGLKVVRRLCSFAGEHKGPEFGTSTLPGRVDHHATLHIFRLDDVIAKGQDTKRQAIEVGFIHDVSLLTNGWIQDKFGLHVLRSENKWMLGAIPYEIQRSDKLLPFDVRCVLTSLTPAGLIKSFGIKGVRLFLPDKRPLVEAAEILASEMFKEWNS